MTKTHRKILQIRLKLSTAPQSCVTFPWKFITVKRLIGEWIADVYSVHFADVLSVTRKMHEVHQFIFNICLLLYDSFLDKE